MRRKQTLCTENLGEEIKILFLPVNFVFACRFNPVKIFIKLIKLILQFDSMKRKKGRKLKAFKKSSPITDTFVSEIDFLFNTTKSTVLIKKRFYFLCLMTLLNEIGWISL